MHQKLHHGNFYNLVRVYDCSSVRIAARVACLLEGRLNVCGPHELDSEKGKLGVRAVHEAAETRDVRTHVGDVRRADSRQVLHGELRQTTVEVQWGKASANRFGC